MLRYDPPTGDYAATTPPGTRALATAIPQLFKIPLVEIARDRDRCPPQGPSSRHCDRKAIDAYPVQLSNDEGWRLASWLVQHAEALGIQAVIYDRRVWGFAGWYWRTYTGGHDHRDHIHTEQNDAGAATLTDQQIRRLVPPMPGGEPVTIVYVAGKPERYLLSDHDGIARHITGPNAELRYRLYIKAGAREFPVTPDELRAALPN